MDVGVQVIQSEDSGELSGDTRNLIILGSTSWPDLWLIPPGLHTCSLEPVNTSWMAVLFPMSMLQLMPDVKLPAVATRVECSEARGRWQMLGVELRCGGVGSNIAVDALARLLLVQVLRKVGTNLVPWQLKDVLAHIEQNLMHEIRLSELAELHGWSQFHFSRYFKRWMGVSPHQYVLQQRIERAKSLLGDSGLELADIALESGFSNQSHFGSTFRRLTGLTPNQYRRVGA